MEQRTRVDKEDIDKNISNISKTFDKFINLKARHLGKNPLRAINEVEMLDGSKRRNYINLEFKNFSVTEKGDLQDVVNAQSGVNVNVATNNGEEVPMILRE